MTCSTFLRLVSYLWTSLRIVSKRQLWNPTNFYVNSLQMNYRLSTICQYSTKTKNLNGGPHKLLESPKYEDNDTEIDSPKYEDR